MKPEEARKKVFLKPHAGKGDGAGRTADMHETPHNAGAAGDEEGGAHKETPQAPARGGAKPHHVVMKKHTATTELGAAASAAKSLSVDTSPNPRVHGSISSGKGKRSYKKAIKSGVMCFIVLLVCVAGLSWMVGRCLRGATVGTFGSIEGTVTVSHKTGSMPAKMGAEIKSDSTVVTEGAGSKAQVLYPDGGRVQVEAGSSVGVGLAKRNVLSFKGKWLRLDRGEVYLEIPEQSAKYPMRIVTQFTDGNLTRANCGLSVSSNTVSLYVAEGSVNFTRKLDRATVVVDSGCYAVADDRPEFESRSIQGDTKVRDLSLVEAGSELPIAGYAPLRSGIELNARRIQMGFVVRAQTDPSLVGSVKFLLKGPDGEQEFIVNSPPYICRGSAKAVEGEGWQPRNGQYKLTAWSFTKKDGKGKRSAARTVDFTVKS